MLESLGKTLLLAGLALAALGSLLVAGAKLGLGRLPGDVVVRGERWVVAIPVVTSILLSILLTALIALASWWRDR